MGLMNLFVVSFGAFPMCHESGGIAGKYAFGARTAGANVLVGMGYIGVAVLAVGVVAAYPTAVLGVILALVVVVGLVGLLVNLAVVFLLGVGVSVIRLHWAVDSPNAERTDR